MKTWGEVRDELWPDGLPEPTCDRCGGPLGREETMRGQCRAGNCTEYRCGSCNFLWGGVGPVGCPCQSRDPRLRRIRAMYRARRR